MITMNDLVAGRLLVDRGLTKPEFVREGLRHCHSTSASLLDHLARIGQVPKAALQSVTDAVRRYGMLRTEAIYLALLRERRAVPEDWIERARTRQRDEDYSRRLGELLVQAGQLTAAQDEFLRRQCYESSLRSAGETIKREAGESFQRFPASFPLELSEGVSLDHTRRFRATGIVASREMSRILDMTPATPATPGEERLHFSADDFDGGEPGGDTMPMAPAPTFDPDMPFNVEQTLHMKAPNFNDDGFGAPTTSAGSDQDETGAMPTPAGLAAPSPPPAAQPTGATGATSGAPGEGEQIGPFTVIDKLGEGGNGTVYLVRSPDYDEPVALKVVSAAKGGKEALARFKREILATSFFDHPNVVEIFDAGQLEDCTFMVMEHVKGRELRALMEELGGMPAARVFEILRRLLSALGAAHRARIVHRDLKPENIMVREDADGDQVTLMDFGIARIQDQPEEFSEQIFQTMKGRLSGSPKYMSPESIEDEDLDARTDIYSIGILTFEMLTGRIPYEAKTSVKMLQAHMKHTPMTLVEADPDLDLPDSVQRFITRCLEKAPDARYQSAEEALAFVTGRIQPELARHKPKVKAEPAQESAKDGTNAKEKAAGERRGCLGWLFRRGAKPAPPAPPPPPEDDLPEDIETIYDLKLPRGGSRPG